MGRDVSEHEETPKKGRGDPNMMIGPVVVRSESTMISQAQMPEGDVELRTFSIRPELLKVFHINNIQFRHRTFTTEERREYDRLDGVRSAHVAAFWVRNGWAMCDACGAYGCTPPQRPGTTYPKECSLFKVAKQPPIAEEERRLFQLQNEELWKPMAALYERTNTVLFEIAGAGRPFDIVRILSKFPNGKLAIAGRLPAGHLVTISVTNVSPSEHSFGAKIAADFV